MSDTASWASSSRSRSKPASTHSRNSARQRQEGDGDENTPLLSADVGSIEERNGAYRWRRPSSSSALLDSIHESIHSFGGAKTKGKKWSSVIALCVLSAAVVLIMLLGFMAPEIMEEYANEALVFEPDSLSVPEFTSYGARARIQGQLRVDGSRVRRKSVRDLGRFGTWIAREVKTGEADVEVYLPEYGNVVLGTAKVPSVKVRIRDGSVTPIDILADLRPGPPDGIRQLADEWMHGRLGQLRVRGKAHVSLQSGIIYIPKQEITKTILIDDSEVPGLPGYDLSRLNVHEVELPDGKEGLSVDVSASIQNDWPFDFSVPPLGFAILVDNCLPSEPYIMVADARAESLHIRPREDIRANVTGYVRQLPEELKQVCPESRKSPLDALLGGYMNGEETTIYVRGSDSPSPNTPKWISDLMADITVPIALAGREFGSLIRNFSLADVHFDLPDPFAEPESDEAQPKVSARIDAVVNLPEEMNFAVNVSRVRADADVYYHDERLGRLDLHKWQTANSTRIEARGEEKPGLAVEAMVKDAPLRIQNETLFTDIVQKLLFGDKPVLLTIKADVDVEMRTALGKLRVQEIPAKGVVPVKPISGGGGGSPGPDVDDLGIKFGNMSILDSTPDSLTLGVLVNFTNPTNYSATVPYLDINLAANDTLLGHGLVRNVTVRPGNNSNIPVTAVWCPSAKGGAKGRTVGKELLSQYISGFNTTLALQAHEASIPSQPALGRALEALKFVFPAPRLRTPKPHDPSDPDDPDDDDDDDDEAGRFIRAATIHLLSSTAVFTLASPLEETTLFITHVNATAFYRGDAVGRILHREPFAVPPALSDTPRLPVEWILDSVGYEAVRKALGGALRLAARADVGVRLGRWEERVWFAGEGIGARVRL